MGGDCTWTGCVPSKALLASSKTAHAISKAGQFGIEVEGKVKVDMKAVKKRVDDSIQHIYDEDDSPEALKKLGVDVISGVAKFTDSKTLSVCMNDDGYVVEICAKDGILLATGAKPKHPSITGIQDVEYITYEEAFSLDEVPDKMTVIGAGPIGCELAQAYSRLGATVTVVASNILPREEPEVGEMMQRVFESEGIAITNSRVENVDGSGGKAHTVTCNDGQTISGDLLLVAIGREPNVKGTGLESLGVKLNERGRIETDSKLQTSVKGLYATLRRKLGRTEIEVAHHFKL